ncbi:hypothetical protein CY652_01160 [Burkholderia sp. WAC0059]|uniref:tetratricopeptide repeat protein n=1 Tax=Burkholderia sp. WAC0059 TaxID=2066022 RepID=UPI000C7F24BA|nr:tetratricopeptide repeat protein [Burkholderia sp. WAC0059]PLZ04312.1 hypothetical protein CY652_01160 [Burkholderia sp. WAC0059]
MQTDERFALANERHLAGDFAAARKLYESIPAGDAVHADALFRLAVIALQENAPAEALDKLQRALAVAPNHPRYRFALGQTLMLLQRFDDAVALYRQLLAEDDGAAHIWSALAGAWQAQGQWRAAADAWRAAAGRDATSVDAWNNLGNCHRLLGEPDAAQTAYRRALAVQPDDANALTNLGTLLQAQGRGSEAVGLLRAAVAAAPDASVNLVNLGVALCGLGQFDEAVQALERASALDPRFAQAAYNLGLALQGLGRLDEARQQYLRALALDSRHASAANNLGNVCRELGEFGDAAQAFEAAMRIQPGFVVARNNAANLKRALGRLDEAHALLREALGFDAAHSPTWNNLGNVLKDRGELDEGIECYRRAVACDPDNVVAHSNLAYALSFQSDEGAPMLDECRRWAARHEAPLRASRVAPVPDRTPGRRLRIGYVSADFRDHCQSLFTTPLLAHHDRARFEIHGYASVLRPDAVTARLAGQVEVWHDVRRFDDAALAQRIRADGIDILVDLAMHMADGRPLLFARQPAPAQVAWLAYPGTTGLDAIEYRLTDPHLDPPGHDDHYRERSLRLPDTFWCYDPLTDTPGVNALPALERGHVTFGSLNNTCKLTDRTLGLWSAVLRALPDARLLLMAAGGEARAKLAGRLARSGIDPRRVDFVPFRPRDAYLRTYHAIDLGLDTLPYNGHTTSLDSFWMGVPVVTRIGATAAGRAGLSQLANLGLDDLAAESDEAFVRTAVALAGDLPRLAALRAGLRGRMERSPLMDGARFARQVEAAYERIWEETCRKAGA